MVRAIARKLLAALVFALVLCSPGSAATYKVPKRIPDDCSVPVESEIMAWLATVPDGNTAQFGSRRCYGQDGTITLRDRAGLTIDGQGSEFRALTQGGSDRANWRLAGGRGLTVRNVAVRGSNPEGTYDPALEWQHGFAVDGVQGLRMAGVQARETWGDGIMIWHGAAPSACEDHRSSARNVAIANSLLTRNGRQGLAIVDGEFVTLQDSIVGPVEWSNVDVETDNECELARHVSVVRNLFGANRYGVIANVGFGADPNVGDLIVAGNIQTAVTGAAGECWAPVRIVSPAAAYRGGYVFRRNRFLARRNGLEFGRVRNIDVSSNNVTLIPTTGCGKRAGVLLGDAHSVGIANNLFSGASHVFTSDALTTDVTAEGNSRPRPRLRQRAR